MWGFNGVRQKRGQEQSGDGRTQVVGGGRSDGMLRGKNVMGTGLDGRRDGNSDKTGDGMVRGRRGEAGRDGIRVRLA